jgi:hypothetical protein
LTLSCSSYWSDLALCNVSFVSCFLSTSSFLSISCRFSSSRARTSAFHRSFALRVDSSVLFHPDTRCWLFFFSWSYMFKNNI